MGAMKGLAEEFILEAEEKGAKVEDLITDFAKDYGIDAVDLYVVVRELMDEDEEKCEKIDKLLD